MTNKTRNANKERNPYEYNEEFKAMLNQLLEKDPFVAGRILRYYFAIGPKKLVIPYPPEDAKCEAAARAMRGDVKNFFAMLASNLVNVYVNSAQ